MTDDSFNGVGIRAHDGNSGADGTELNVYAYSYISPGILSGTQGTTQAHTYYPYITSGCQFSQNNFDLDVGNGATGQSFVFTRRGGGYDQTIGNTSLSRNGTWANSPLITATDPNNWTSGPTNAIGYGIWTAVFNIEPSSLGDSNYTTIYLGNSNATNPPPNAQPQANTFRIYLPTDASAAPVKPYVEQLLTHNAGPNPPLVSQTTRYTVTVRVVNPTPQPITFSANNLVIANVPGSGATYNGNAQVSQGTITAQPSIGGTGNITWNPGIVAANSTVLLAYQVNVTPPAAAAVNITGTPASNGTTARFVDQTGNTTQALATYAFGPLCQLAVTPGEGGTITHAVVSSLTAHADAAGSVVEWQTASEIGTLGFYLERQVPGRDEYVPVNQELLMALPLAAQGGVYRYVDEEAVVGLHYTYRLVEVEMSGKRNIYGPYTVAVAERKSERVVQQSPQAVNADYSREPHPLNAVPTPARAVARAASAAPTGVVKLGVRDSGLYYLTTAEIGGWLGLSAAQVQTAIRQTALVLRNRGQVIPWRPASGQAGIYFYGQAIDSPYTRDNVYWLQKGANGEGRRMGTFDSQRPPPATVDQTFADTQTREEDAMPVPVLPADPDSDYWYWKAASAGDGGQSFTLRFDGVATTAGNATLRMRGRGASAATTHNFTVSLNGTVIGTGSGANTNPFAVDLPFSQSLLQEGDNTVTVSASTGVFFIDGFKLTYQRRYQAVQDSLLLAAGNNPIITAGGFSNDTIQVLDITNPAAPVYIINLTIDNLAGQNRASFRARPNRRYMAATGSGLRKPLWTRSDVASILRQPDNSADYLIIAPRDLAAAAETLARYRSAIYQTQVVDLEDIHDEFNAGLASPKALRDFLKFALQNWSVKPRFVLLLGNGTLDYRNLLGGNDNLIPPLLINTQEGGLFASDALLADPNGDGRPELAVGRLPVLDAAGVAAYLAKLSAHDSAEGYALRMLLVADNAEPEADFASDSDTIAQILDGAYKVDTVYLPGAAALQKTQRDLFRILNLPAGRNFVNYLGHGGMDRLTAEGLLTNADVATSLSQNRPFVFSGLTCLINRFEIPDYASLGELLVLQANGGAITTWAPAGLSLHSDAVKLNEALFDAYQQPGVSTVGEAIQRAVTDYVAAGHPVPMTYVYVLLGDPTARLP